MTAPTSAQITDFVVSTRFEDLPADVVARIRWLILDTVAVAVAGADQPGPRALVRFERGRGSRSTSTVIGTSLRCSPDSAALINGTAAHALDYDDNSYDLAAHPSAVLVPTLLALSEERKASGRDLILAYAVAYEAAAQLSRVINPEHYNHGWHGTGTLGTLAATFAAARLLALNEQQVTSAIALGAAQAAGLRGSFGTDVKPFQAGNAARSGVVAAKLAQEGFGGHPEILERPFGFIDAFTPSGGHRENWSLSSPEWTILSPGILTKLFPSCGSTHGPVGATLRYRDVTGPESADTVERIDVAVTRGSLANLQYPRPASGLQGKFSLQYCVARALIDGTVGIDAFTDEAIADERITRIMPRIHMHHDPALTAARVWGTGQSSVMHVTRTDGSTWEYRADAPPGSTADFSSENLVAKVQDCLGRASTIGSAEQVIDLCTHLDACDDLAGLMTLVSAQ